jgi:DNA/RNA endonuclease G (NUC1)
MIFRGVFNVKRLQPGRVGARAEIRSFGNTVMSLTHDCSTLGGNSGSAVVDSQTGSVLALHFAGRYLEANYAVPAHAFSLDWRVVDAGVAFDGDVHPPSTADWEHSWALADPTPTAPTGPAEGKLHPSPGEGPGGGSSPPTGPAGPAGSPATTEQKVVLNVPLDISVRVGTPVTGTPPIAASATALTGGAEAVVEPFHDEDLHNRAGYDEMFLGMPLPLPEVLAGVPVTRLDDDAIELAYEHFSAVMNKDRRLAHFLAANVDGRPSKTAPEPTRDYTRNGLGGLGRNDREKWFTDPRIPADHQLPDRFFNRDRGSFDKGHIIRRTYVAWGDSYDQVRRANGDTYHVTNCSPQIAAFNQSGRQGVWGKLEDLVQAQAATETYSVFAGPIFRDDDPCSRAWTIVGARRSVSRRATGRSSWLGRRAGCRPSRSRSIRTCRASTSPSSHSTRTGARAWSECAISKRRSRRSISPKCSATPTRRAPISGSACGVKPGCSGATTLV